MRDGTIQTFSTEAPATSLLVITRGDVADDARACAHRRIGAVIEHIDEPILSADGERYVFFVNTGTGRGNVIYHRFDDHYGLIAPD